MAGGQHAVPIFSDNQQNLHVILHATCYVNHVRYWAMNNIHNLSVGSLHTNIKKFHIKQNNHRNLSKKLSLGLGKKQLELLDINNLQTNSKTLWTGCDAHHRHIESQPAYEEQ